MDSHTDDGTSPSSFADALASLGGGRNLLVVGSVPSAAAVAACRRLFDEAYRGGLKLLASTRSGELELGGLSHVEVVRYQIQRRGCAAESKGRPDETRVTDGRLSTLGRAISDRILEFERATGNHTETAVRVCFDSLSDLLVEYERESVFRFVNMMTGQIRNVGGVGQFHVSLCWESETVQLLAPLFDAVVELRVANGGYRYRWRSPDGPSEWRPL